MARHPEHVQIGSVVVTRDASGARETYTIVAAADADPRAGRVASTSPIGRALLGRRAGEPVTVPAPGGSFTLLVESVSEPPSEEPI